MALLIPGLFTGIVAFIGGFMNWNFGICRRASTNPVLFTISIFLILAWKVAGWYGLTLGVTAGGTPWQPKVVPAAVQNSNSRLSGDFQCAEK